MLRLSNTSVQNIFTNNYCSKKDRFAYPVVVEGASGDPNECTPPKNKVCP